MIDHEDEDEDDVRRGLMRRLRTEGVAAAYEAALALCQDPKSPAQARANAANSIFRVAGWFGTVSEPDEKPLEELSASELARRVERSRRAVEAIEKRLEADRAASGGGLFD